MQKRIVLFGSFDPLHEGHKDLFRQAKELGDYLIVVVDRDSTIERLKKRAPHMPQQKRLAAVQADPSVDEALSGDEDPPSYNLLTTLDYSILALGYDQTPSNEESEALLRRIGKQGVHVVRLAPFKPEQYKSTYLRNE